MTLAYLATEYIILLKKLLVNVKISDEESIFIVDLPKWIIDVFYTYLTSELIYISDDYPLATPVTTFYDEDEESIIVTTSIAFYNKIKCIKSNPNVAILYSRSGYNDIDDEPIVLVQGRAIVHDKDFNKNRDYLANLLPKQRESWKKTVYIKMARELSTFLGRILMDWYMIRVIIEVKPHRVFAWHDGNIDKSPDVFEVI